MMMTTRSRTDRQIIDDLLGSELAGAPAPSTARAHLHDDLVARAARADLLDVSYRTVDSPLGPLLLAATPAGLVRVAFDLEGHDEVLAQLAVDVSPRILWAPAPLDEVTRQLDEYFAGHRRTFEVPIDLQLAHGFRRTVLDRLRDIAYGTTASYSAVAAAAGSPAAVRAVGTACAHNPVPVVVPCHRVIRRDGSIGQYLGGPEAKRALLDLEAA
jgi:methylated-DNA-[protein]-cysteine S-methyltransferase